MKACFQSLKEKECKLKSAERKVSDLTAKLKYADKNRFGDKRQKVKKAESAKAEESDRGKFSCKRMQSQVYLNYVECS